MKKSFGIAPPAIKAAVVITALYPSIISILMFKLYLKPGNPSAFEVIAMLTVPYCVAAFLLLKGFRVMRFIAAAWAFLGIVYALGFGIKAWTGYWDVLWIVILGWILQLTVVALLYSPQGNRHFTPKTPNQSLQPTGPSARG